MNERKKLLPKWIRFFCWIFIIFWGHLLFFIVGLFVGDMHYNLFGVSYYGPALRPLPIVMMLVLMIHGVAAYGLLWGKRRAVDIGILCLAFGSSRGNIGVNIFLSPQ